MGAGCTLCPITSQDRELWHRRHADQTDHKKEKGSTGAKQIRQPTKQEQGSTGAVKTVHKTEDCGTGVTQTRQTTRRQKAAPGATNTIHRIEEGRSGATQTFHRPEEGSPSYSDLTVHRTQAGRQHRGHRD